MRPPACEGATARSGRPLPRRATGRVDVFSRPQSRESSARRGSQWAAAASVAAGYTRGDSFAGEDEDVRAEHHQGARPQVVATTRSGKLLPRRQCAVLRSKQTSSPASP